MSEKMNTNDTMKEEPESERAVHFEYYSEKETAAENAGKQAKTAAKGRRFQLSGGPDGSKRFSVPWLRVLYMPLAFIYFEILLRAFCGTGIFTNLIYPVLFGIAFGLFLDFVTMIFPKVVNRILSILALLLGGIYYIVECLILRSFTTYMTLHAVLTGAGGVTTGYSSDLIRAIVTGIPVIILFLLPAIFYIILDIRKKVSVRCSIPAAIVILICAVLCQGVGVLAASHGSSRAKYTSQYNFNTAIRTFGLVTGTRLDVQHGGTGGSSGFVLSDNGQADAGSAQTAASAETAASASTSESDGAYVNNDRSPNVMDIDFEAKSAETDDETLKEMNAYVSSLTPTNRNAYTGIFKGKNLILICAEAFSDSVIDPELTPTLYRLTHNGIYFSDYYQPTWGGSTSTGEYSFLIGLAPLDGVDTMLETVGHNNYFTMGSQLMRQGYFSRAYHSGDYDYYSRNLTHENLGYAKFLALGNGLEDITDYWPDDEDFFSKTMDTYMDQEPFSIYYMTLSGHAAYDADDDRVKEHYDEVNAVVGDKYKEKTKYYLCYQMELEDALTTMVQKLEDAGIADDTVIALTADHYPYGLDKSDTFGNTENYVNDLYGMDYQTHWEKDHNSLIIWSGCLEHQDKDLAIEVSDPTFSLDVVPTLSNMFGLEYDSRLLPGRDVMADNGEAIVFWNDYSWVTTHGTYDADSGEFTPNDGYEYDQDYIDRISQTVQNKILYSGQALDKDYFGYLFGSTEETTPRPEDVDVEASYIAAAEAAAAAETSESAEAEETDGPKIISDTPATKENPLTTGEWVDGGDYYLLPNEEYATGWVYDPDTEGYYYMDSTGLILTGWQQIDGQYYYFYTQEDSSEDEEHDRGHMAADTTIDGYYVNADGVWE